MVQVCHHHHHHHSISYLIFPSLKPFENEEVSGEIRVQITYEHYKVRIHWFIRSLY